MLLYGFWSEEIKPCTAGYVEMENVEAAQELLEGLTMFRVARRGNALCCFPNYFVMSLVHRYGVPLEWMEGVDWQSLIANYRSATGTDLSDLFCVEKDEDVERYVVDMPEVFHRIMRKGTSAVTMDLWLDTSETLIFGVAMRRISNRPGVEDLELKWGNWDPCFDWLENPGSLAAKELQALVERRNGNRGMNREEVRSIFGYTTLERGVRVENLRAAVKLFRRLGLKKTGITTLGNMHVEGSFSIHSNRTRSFWDYGEKEAAASLSEPSEGPFRHPPYLLLRNNHVLHLSAPEYISGSGDCVPALLKKYARATGTDLSGLASYRFGLAYLNLREILKQCMVEGEVAISVGHDTNDMGEIQGASVGRISRREGMDDLYFTFEDLAALLNRGDPCLDRELCPVEKNGEGDTSEEK